MNWRDKIVRNVKIQDLTPSLVIGSKSGFSITIEFLGLMKAYWFRIAQHPITKRTEQTR
jgi:hypothetical protein